MLSRIASNVCGKSLKIHAELVKHLSKASIQNRSKNDSKSMEMCPWSFFGAKSCSGRLQNASGTVYRHNLGALLVEIVVPKTHFRFGPPKMVAGRKVGKNMENK